MKEVNKRKDSRRNKAVPIFKKIESQSNKKETVKIEGPNLKDLELEIESDIKKEHIHSDKHFSFYLAIFIILVIIFIVMHFMTPKIHLVGEKQIEINYQEEYIEQGATANLLSKDITDELMIKDNINIEKVGTYHVVYSVKYGFYTIKKERTVKVVDKKNPVITLEGESEINICPNAEFKEIGYTATDEYDGDITDKVKVKTSKDRITYTVKDSSGNVFSIIRKINKMDEEKPTITLKGNATMYLGLDEDFKEPGFMASDNCSGDLTDKVVVTGNVQARQKGTYTLNYQVEDESGNQTTVIRTVIVSEKTDPNSGEIKKGVIYLTFDDGPSNITTGQILNVLKEEGIKATFFVTNNGPDYLIKRMYDEGHTVGLHTASHNYATVYQSVDSYFQDLKTVSDRVERITGQTSKIIRFPGGSSNTISKRYCLGIMTKLVEEVFNRGYRYYDWNIDSGDASSAKTKEAVYNNVVSHLSKNKANVVLMHDTKTVTRDAIRDIIHYGKENGYTFERIDMDTHMVRQYLNN